MNIIKKIKTALLVFSKYGAGEATWLIADNIAAAFEKICFRLTQNKAGRALRNLASILFHRNDTGIKILYLTDEYEALHSQSVRYRITNLRQALRGRVQTRLEIIENGVCNDERALEWADIIVLMRLKWSLELESIVQTAKRSSIPLVYDIDDIIFMPEYAEGYCRALGEFRDERIAAKKSEMAQYGEAFGKCDFSTASTPFIAEKMSASGMESFVIHNGLNSKQLRIAKRSRCRRGAARARYIGFLSGTKTHDFDFQQAVPALSRILREYDDVELRIAGYLDLSALPEDIARKTSTSCYMRWGRLMAYSAANYINIAPLDISNPFCHAKSELKYFEAGILGVPTVASATDTFKRCIRPGENGMLAASDDEWYACFKALLDDKPRYESICNNAIKDALARYVPEKIAAESLMAYDAIIKTYDKTAH
jgi:glycosyltransferase involved in cell wall biosynthesis